MTTMNNDSNDVREILRVMLKPNGNVGVGKERGFLDRAEHAAAIEDVNGTGYLWLDSYNNDPMLCIEGPNGNTSCLDLRIVLSLCVGMIEQAQKQTMKMRFKSVHTKLNADES